MWVGGLWIDNLMDVLIDERTGKMGEWEGCMVNGRSSDGLMNGGVN